MVKALCSLIMKLQSPPPPIEVVATARRTSLGSPGLPPQSTAGAGLPGTVQRGGQD
ncbi:hypothetical protein CDL15_Pgr023925 [Punica granatum]|nr:hypothetical protein CDL15_Pgr023925 [Punica granatum]